MAAVREMFPNSTSHGEYIEPHWGNISSNKEAARFKLEEKY